MAKQLHNFALFMIKSPYINIPIIIVSLTGSSATKGILFEVLPHISPYIYIDQCYIYVVDLQFEISQALLNVLSL